MIRQVILLALAWGVVAEIDVFPPQHDLSQYNRKCGKEVTSTASALLNKSDVTTVFFVFEDSEDPCVYDMIRNINYSIKLQLFHYTKFTSVMKPVIESLVTNEDIDLMRRSLNIIIICSVECVRSSLEMSRELDVDYGKKSVLRHFSRWIIVNTDFQREIPVTNVTLDNVVLLSEDKKTSVAELSTLLWQKSGREWSVLDHGCTKSLCPSDRVFPNTKLGLNKRELIVSSLEWLPFSKKERQSNTTSYTGLSGDILAYLSNRFNFSYQYVEPPDFSWGQKLENGFWTGIIGMLQREEADICSAPYAFSLERAKVMSFTYPILMEFSTVIYKKATDENKTWKVLISCFKWEVYAVGSVVVGIVMLTYLFLLSFASNPTKAMKEMKTRRYIDSFMIGLMGPFLQAAKTPPLFNSGRVLFGTWFLFCLIMTSIYKGNLMAFLAVDRLNVPFRTLQELANQDVYDVGTPAGNYLSLTIQTSDQPVMKALWKKIEKTQKNNRDSVDGNYEHQVRRLHEGNFAFLQSNVAADVLLSQTCDLAKINEVFLPSSSSMVFTLHSPLARLFHHEIMTIIENGLYQKWYETWVPRPMICTDDSIAVGVSQLHIQEYYSAVAACGAGICLASLVLLAETYMNEFMSNLVGRV